MILAAITANTLAIALVYGSLPQQRWFSNSLPSFPALTSASLAALVALKGWTLSLGLLAGFAAWCLAAIPALALLGAIHPRARALSH